MFTTAKWSHPSLSIRDINAVFTEYNNLFEEPSPLQGIALDLDKSDVKHLATIRQRLAVYLNLPVQTLLPPVEGLDLDVGHG